MGRDGESWNYAILIGQGISWDCSRSLASPRLVLPFLYIALGAPVLFAGLLLPIVQVSRLIGTIAAAPVVSAASLRKWHGAIGIIVIATSLAIIGLAARTLHSVWLVTVFLLVAAIIGVARGIITVAYQDLLGRVLPSNRQSTLLYEESALAGLLAMAIAWGSNSALPGTDPLDGHLALLWAAAGVCFLSGLCIAIIRERPPERGTSPAPSPKAVQDETGYLTELREGFRAVVGLAWFRRFLVARGLFLSIELATPFYAIHAATLHKDKLGSLSVFVIASCAGVIVGGPLWRRVSRDSIRLVMALSSAIAAAGGLLAIAVQLWPQLQYPIAHAGVFFLMSIAAHGIVNARTVYLVGCAPEAERLYFIVVADTLTGGLGVLVAFAFGVLAHFSHVVWPIIVILGLNISALIYTRRLQPFATEAESCRTS